MNALLLPVTYRFGVNAALVCGLRPPLLRLGPASASNLCHVGSVPTHRTATFSSSLSCFFLRKPMCLAKTVSRLASTPGNFPLLLWDHRGESLSAFAVSFHSNTPFSSGQFGHARAKQNGGRFAQRSPSRQGMRKLSPTFPCNCRLSSMQAKRRQKYALENNTTRALTGRPPRWK